MQAAFRSASPSSPASREPHETCIVGRRRSVAGSLMYGKTVIFEKFEKKGLFEAKTKTTKNARRINLFSGQKVVKNVFALSKIGCFWQISNALAKIPRVFLPIGHPKGRFFDPPS